MSDSISDIPWAMIQGPYGPVPEMLSWLRAAASANAGEARTALSWVWNNVVHQGTRWHSTAVAIPFLFRILENPNCFARSEIAWGIQGLATDEIVPLFPDGFDPDQYFMQVRNIVLDPADVQAIWSVSDWGTLEPRLWDLANLLPFRYHYDAYLAVEREAHSFMNLASDRDPQVRMAALASFLYFPAVAPQALPVLRRVVQSETDPFVLANGLLALGLAGKYAKDSNDAACLESMVRLEDDGIVQLTAAMALAVVLGPTTPNAALEVLIEATGKEMDVMTDYTQRASFNTSLLGYVWQILHAFGL